MEDIKVIKKNGVLVDYDEQKIIDAVSKSAKRALQNLTNEDYVNICNMVWDEVQVNEEDNMISVYDMHTIVVNVLSELFPRVAESYRLYRNYKEDFVKMMDECYEKEQETRYVGDKSNANTDSAMVSTRRSISYGIFSSALYDKFFLNQEELQTIKDGYIYIHDKKDRRDTMNCCLCDMKEILTGGFEMGNIWYNEPKTLDTAFDVISDVTLAMASQQYGGFTIPEVDTLLVPYAEKSYKKYYDEYYTNFDNIFETAIYGDNLNADSLYIKKLANKYAMEKVRREMEQGFQGWEYKFNTVASSRGDYPFIAVSFGIEKNKFGQMATECILKVRKEGQGKEGFKKPVLFPKLTFLYDENLHGEGKELEYLFDEAVECSSKCMYPDFLSLTGEGYIPSMYKKYGKVVSLMGCRASLSPWYIKGGMKPLDETDEPIFIGRFNLGAISLHLPMILAKSRKENKDFYKVLDYYLEMIRNLHKRTYDYLGEQKASTNPIGYMQGGFYGGHLKADDKIKPLLAPMTMSFGITALNELQELYNGKSLVEDGEFALEVMKYINDKVNQFKEEDHILYAIYGTPAESLCGLQVEQFRKKYGIIQGVSDRTYVSNSFHCGVWEDISPIQKQDLEKRFWGLFNGGKIQYCKYPISYNKKAIKDLIRRAMKMGFYEGVNLSLAYCEDCGYEQLDMEVCPKCGSTMITQIERMNGYLGFKKIHGDTRYNKAKMDEFKERVSM